MAVCRVDVVASPRRRIRRKNSPSISGTMGPRRRPGSERVVSAASVAGLNASTRLWNSGSSPQAHCVNVASYSRSRCSSVISASFHCRTWAFRMLSTSNSGDQRELEVTGPSTTAAAVSNPNSGRNCPRSRSATKSIAWYSCCEGSRPSRLRNSAEAIWSNSARSGARTTGLVHSSRSPATSLFFQSDQSGPWSERSMRMMRTLAGRSPPSTRGPITCLNTDSSHLNADSPAIFLDAA